MNHIAHIISNWTNPALAVLLLIAIFVQQRRGAWTPIVLSAIGIGMAVMLAEFGKRYLLYPDPGGFPSGHETFATATSACLVWANRRWLFVVIPISIVMAAALVIAGFHRPVDVVGAAVLGPIPPSALLAMRGRLGRTKASGDGSRIS